MKVNYRFFLFLIGISMLISCISNQAVVRPNLVFRFYDAKTKKSLSDIKLTINGEKSNTLVSNKNGIIKIPRKKSVLGNHYILPLEDAVFSFQKENYQSGSLNYIEYFRLNNASNRNKTYVSDSISVKMELNKNGQPL